MRWSFLTRDGLRASAACRRSTSALFKISLVIRLTRAGVRETMLMDYVKFARAKGLSPAGSPSCMCFKNILIPVVTVVGLEFGGTIAFSVVTESVFAWPGMGKLIIDSINVLDRPVMVAYLMIIVLMFITINLVVDITYSLLDPARPAGGQVMSTHDRRRAARPPSRRAAVETPFRRFVRNSPPSGSRCSAWWSSPSSC